MGTKFLAIAALASLVTLSSSTAHAGPVRVVTFLLCRPASLVAEVKWIFRTGARNPRDLLRAIRSESSIIETPPIHLDDAFETVETVAKAPKLSIKESVQEIVEVESVVVKSVEPVVVKSSDAAHKFNVLDGKLTVGKLTKIGSLEIGGGERNIYRTGAVVGATAVYCTTRKCNITIATLEKPLQDLVERLATPLIRKSPVIAD